MMSATPAFAQNYASCRERFHELCAAAGLSVDTWQHARTGPAGEPLGVDVARAGDMQADRLLIVSSGTHGVEGYCGSGIQAALLEHDLQASLPPGVALLLVHAVNPYGFAWARRTDENNVDLNRNFVEHDGSYPANSAYEEVHPMLVPADWDGPARHEADCRMAQYVKQHGVRALQAAVCGGQYAHPDGLFFGGHQSAWANMAWRQILARYAGSAAVAAILDVHTGLGAHGACELISGAWAGGPEREMATRWFGDRVVFPGENSTAPASRGHMNEALAEALPDTACALVVAEFGTVPFDRILEVLRADNWIHLHEKPGSRRWRDVKAAMLEAFVDDAPAWRDAVVGQAIEICRRVGRALAEETNVDTPNRAKGAAQ